MEKCVVWYWLSLKQNMKKTGTWLLLGAMLFLLWLVDNIHMPDVANTQIAICYNGSAYEQEIRETIQNADAEFSFHIFENPKDVEYAVKAQTVECGFVFADDFDEKIIRGYWKDAVICYENPFGTKTDVAKEALYAALFPIYSRWLLTDTQDDIYYFEDPQRLEELLETHDAYLRNTLFLTFEEITIETKNSNTKTGTLEAGFKNTGGIAHGLVEVFVLLAMLLAAGVYGQKELVQIEKALPIKEKRWFCYINILANGSFMALAGFAAILFTAQSRGLLTEAVAMLALLLIGGLFAYLFMKCFKNRLTYISWVVTFVIFFMVARFGIIGVLRG